MRRTIFWRTGQRPRLTLPSSAGQESTSAASRSRSTTWTIACRINCGTFTATKWRFTNNKPIKRSTSTSTSLSRKRKQTSSKGLIYSTHPSRWLIKQGSSPLSSLLRTSIFLTLPPISRFLPLMSRTVTRWLAQLVLTCNSAIHSPRKIGRRKCAVARRL